MGVQGMKMSGLSTLGVARYFMKPENFAAYYDAGGRERSTLGPDSVVWGGSQIDGGAVEALGISLTRGITVADLPNLFAGKHLQTGETLSARRGAPVYETDPETGKVLHDDAGHPVRKMAHPLDPISGEPDLSRPLEPVIDHSGGTDMAQELVTMPKGYALAMLAAEKVNPALFNQMRSDWYEVVAEARAFIQDNARVGRRTVPRQAAPAAADAPAAAPSSGAGGTAVALAEAPTTRRQGSDTERVPVQLAMFTTFQWTSRPSEETVSDGRTPDFNPHAHICIARTYLDPVTGKTGTIDTYGLLEATTATKIAAYVDGALHRRAVDRGLKTVWDDFDRDRNGRLVWTIEGIGLDAVRYMSTNHARRIALDAEYAAQNDGRLPSPATSRRLMADSKLPKSAEYKHQDSNPDFAKWHDEMEARGVPLASDELLESLRQPTREVHRKPYTERVEELWRRLEGPNGLNKKSSTFTSYEASSTLMRCAEGLDFTPTELATLEHEVLEHSVVLATPISDGAAFVGADGKVYAPHTVPRTTPEHLTREERTTRSLAKLAEAQFPAVPAAAVQAAVAAQPRELDDEQRAVVDAITAGDGLVFVVGDAGTGKTTAMKPAVDALRAAGVIDRVVVTSTAALTGNNTGHKLDADESGSIQRIVTMARAGVLTIDERTLVVVDEVAMVSTADMDDLLSVASRARLVGVGDPEQSQPIGAGGWFGDATELDHRETVFRLRSVHRQRHEADKATNLAIREGDGHVAMDRLERRGRLHISATQQETWDRIATDNRRFRDQGYGPTDIVVIVPGGTNETVDSLNRLIQNDRIAHGEIPAEGFAYDATSSSGRRGSWSVHDGDPVIFLEPYRRADGERIDNGAMGTVRSVDTTTGRTMIDLDDGTSVQIDLHPSAPTQPFSPRYAVHNMKYQGSENAIVQTVPPASGDNLKHDIYSANTRAVVAAHVYLDHETHGEQPKAHMADEISNSDRDESARQIRDGRTPDPTALTRPDRKQQHKEHSHLYKLQRVIGKDQVQRVKQDQDYPHLMNRLDTLHQSGADAGAMLRNASRKVNVARAEHPAHELNKALRVTPRVEREERRQADPQPRTDYLIGPADRGPAPRPAMDADRAYELRRLGEEMRQAPPSPARRDHDTEAPQRRRPGLDNQIARARDARMERSEEAQRERENTQASPQRRDRAKQNRSDETAQERTTRDPVQEQMAAARAARIARMEQSRGRNRDDGMSR